MVSPARRRDAVRLSGSGGTRCRSVGRAGWSGSTARRSATRGCRPSTSCGWSRRMNELAAAHPRWGYRTVWTLAADGGLAGEPQTDRAAVAARGPPGAAAAEPELGQEGRRGRRRRRSGTCRRLRPNHVWSYDFMSGRTRDGRLDPDPERRRRVHPGRGRLPCRPFDRRPRRDRRARAALRARTASRRCCAPTTAASSSPTPSASGSPSRA